MKRNLIWVPLFSTQMFPVNIIDILLIAVIFICAPAGYKSGFINSFLRIQKLILFGF